MRKTSRVVVLCLLVSSVALGLAIYGAASSRADAPPARPSPTPLAAARFFVLLPDGRVEITDAWSRRTFRWDGSRWTQTETHVQSSSSSR
jgi:hypothetical protein